MQNTVLNSSANIQKNTMFLFERGHGKTYKMMDVPGKDSDQQSEPHHAKMCLWGFRPG